MPSVFTKALWDQRRSIAGFSIGIVAIGVLYALFHPMVNTPEMEEVMRAFPSGLLEALGMTDITSPAGYLGSTTYGILGPILTIIFATLLGTRAIAGDEEAGRLDVLLAHPIERGRFLIERAAAMVVALAIAGTMLFSGMALAAGPAEYTEIGLANLAGATIHLVLLGLFFGALALSVGAVTGRRSWAASVVAVVAVASYFANTLGPAVDWLAWTRDISPFRYYSGGVPLRNGLQLVDALVLLAAAAVLIVVGVIGLRRRDIAV